MAGPSASPRPVQPPADEVRGAVERLLSAPGIARSRRRIDLLRYLSARLIDGRRGEINEYAIGVDVFGRPASFDPRTESTVRAELSRLRKAIGEYYDRQGAQDPFRVELPARGYEMVVTVAPPPAVVETVAQAPPRRRARWWWLAVAAAGLAIGLAAYRYRAPAPIRSVIVLPFENLTGDKDAGYLGDGLAEGLTDVLAHKPALRVVARTSAWQFRGKPADIREIGRRVGADAVVEGSVQKTARGIRITVQVNSAANGYHLLSERFEATLEELPRMDQEIAVPVLAALRAGSQSRREYIPKPAAYDAYLRSRELRGNPTPANYGKAIELLNEAIRIDPQYAAAWAALAGVYASSGANTALSASDASQKLKAAVARALELDPDSAAAWAAEGYGDALYELNWRRGEEELRHATRLMPQNAVAHNWLGVVLMAEGRFGEALPQLREAARLDPLSAAAGATVAMCLYVSRRYPEAIEQTKRVLTAFPGMTAMHPIAAAIYQAAGRFNEAAAEVEATRAAYGDEAENRTIWLLAASGKPDEARLHLDALEKKSNGRLPDHFSKAVIYAALGEVDAGIAEVERSFDERQVWFLNVYPGLDPLRGDPRFQALLVRAGFGP